VTLDRAQGQRAMTKKGLGGKMRHGPPGPVAGEAALGGPLASTLNRSLLFGGFSPV
jgi:hypothetical protein